MITKKFNNLQLSQLGFGTMRLPLLDNVSGKVDDELVNNMVQYAVSNGVNYFDTAYPYHNGESEKIIGRVLKQYDRESYYLATKYPGHQISNSYNPADIFEEQLEKCGVDYFDFYLLHNVYENSIQTYLDSRWSIVDYFVEQKKKGRIKHLGFSCHGSVEIMKEFLDKYGDVMEFCQIQLNYLDWTLQDAKAKYDLLTERNIPIWVMEPVRGGRLASLSPEETLILQEKRPGASMASWAFLWLQTLPNVTMILSGMSNMEQVEDNLKTFSSEKPLHQDEIDFLMEIAEGMKNSLPCTACRYCTSDCPIGLDIPTLISYYNEVRFSNGFNVGMRIDALPLEKRPSACIACGKCKSICPQSIDIPQAMQEFAAALAKMPSWEEICRQREETAEKQKLAKKMI